jgi:hypothetical protein
MMNHEAKKYEPTGENGSVGIEPLPANQRSQLLKPNKVEDEGQYDHSELDVDPVTDPAYGGHPDAVLKLSGDAISIPLKVGVDDVQEE